jgi:hypothetical protein
MSLLRRLFGMKPTIDLPNRGYNALVAASLLMAYNLEDFLKKAERPHRIEAADVEQLVSDLNLICGQSKEAYERKLTSSKDTSTTKWDAEGHDMYVKPFALFIASPDSIVKAAVEATEKGVTEPEVIYKYILSELKTALQRWQISLRTVFRTARPF